MGYKSGQKWFTIRVGDEEWPSFSWYILQHPSLRLEERSGINQESDTGWCTRNYREDLMKSHPKFLPELTQDLLPGFYKCLNKGSSSFNWRDEDKLVIQSTLAACCLVSHEWNRIFTPILYGDIFLGEKKPLVTRSLLHRTFRHTQPAHKALVKTMAIVPAADGSTANLLSICFSMPNLRKLILQLWGFNLSALHPNVVQQLRSLSKPCTIKLREDGDYVNIDEWESLSSYINFVRRSKSASCRFWLGSSGGG